MIAGAAMAMSSVTVVSNANRLRWIKLDDANTHVHPINQSLNTALSKLWQFCQQRMNLSH